MDTNDQDFDRLVKKHENNQTIVLLPESGESLENLENHCMLVIYGTSKQEFLETGENYIGAGLYFTCEEELQHAKSYFQETLLKDNMEHFKVLFDDIRAHLNKIQTQYEMLIKVEKEFRTHSLIN